ncbi:MAG: menaquinone biosynthesis protein [Candidatus Caenarcaniphilales bacterium]|nr:menaquinone biosynthesis protein [Candidatus Caenarcaniphilales bacterium]
MTQLIKIGQISYINCLIFNYPFDLLLSGNKKLETEISSYEEIQKAQLKLETVKDVPSSLNQLLREGKLEIAPISSFEYLRSKNQNPENNYQLVENASISSLGKVHSVIFFSNEEIETLTEINLSHESASSVALLKILLAEKYGLNLKQIKFNTFTNSGSGLTNKLLIGDKALSQIQNHKFKYALDLGQEWFEFSNGLAMVFGLWTHRLGSEAALISKFLHELKDYAIKNLLEDIIIEAYRKTGISKKVLYAYFNELNFDFEDKHEAGLKLYEEHLLKHELI